jgi:hypothetical protein
MENKENLSGTVSYALISVPGGRRSSARIVLTRAIVLRLPRDQRPIGVDANGKLIFEPNLERKDDIVWDQARTAPPGFGVRVSNKKTYVRKFFPSACWP